MTVEEEDVDGRLVSKDDDFNNGSGTGVDTDFFLGVEVTSLIVAALCFLLIFGLSDHLGVPFCNPYGVLGVSFAFHSFVLVVVVVVDAGV